MKRLTALTAAAFLLPVTAGAANLSYNHVEGGLNWADPPSRFGDSDFGLLIRGQGHLNDTIFARGQFQSHRFDVDTGPNSSSTTISRDVLWGGVGFRLPTQQRDLDVYGALDLGYDFGDQDDPGFRLEGGVRAYLDPGWDTTAGIRLWRFNDASSNVQVFGSGYYEVAPQLSLGGELAVGDFDEILFGARYTF